jgi:hypothetical protein
VQQHRDADANGHPVHGREQRLGERLQGVDEGHEPARRRLLRRPRLRHLREVLAGAERALCPGEDDDRNRGVLGRGAQRLGGRVVQVVVEGVLGLGPVEGEDAHAPSVLDQQDVTHAMDSTLSGWPDQVQA